MPETAVCNVHSSNLEYGDATVLFSCYEEIQH